MFLIKTAVHEDLYGPFATAGDAADWCTAMCVAGWDARWSIIAIKDPEKKGALYGIKTKPKRVRK